MSIGGIIYPSADLASPKFVDIRNGVGRHRINGEQTMARFPDGTLERIKGVLMEGEKQSDFIRLAVERELEKRELSRG